MRDTNKWETQPNQKEQNKIPETNPKEMCIFELPDKEF